MHCQKCGVKITGEANFCDRCGVEVGVEVSLKKLPASMGKRLGSYFIDRFVMGMLLTALIILYVVTKSMVVYGVGVVVIYLGYFVVMESIWQKTLGKMIVKTKVVTCDGAKPRFWRIVGRTLARYIPFDSFSFLFGGFPIGWHDRFSKTLVVPDALSTQDVKEMDLEKVKAIKSDNVWLVVVIIIFYFLVVAGIIASVVLTSLSSAKDNTRDAKITESLSYIMEQTAIHSNPNEKNPIYSYIGFCSDKAVKSYIDVLPKLGGVGPVCNESEKTYAISTPLYSGKYFCVDSTGVSAKMDGNLSLGVTACPSR